MTTSPARALPTLARRAFSTTAAVAKGSGGKPTPNKDHHIVQYNDDDFPRGFGVAATHCGIKKNGALDLGVLVSVSERPTAAAACTTRNAFKAAPVTVTTELLASTDGRARGFVVNSGCANAVTGSQGLDNAWAMSKSLTNALAPQPETWGKEKAGSLVMSTGVIGQQLPIEKITSAVPKLAGNLGLDSKSWMDLARAFMTTDTFPKLRCRSFNLAGQTIRMVGIDKGAGMIAPNMGPAVPHATLLGVIATDAAIAPSALQSALNYAVDRSFNSITVDGDMSTNDTILALANGMGTPGNSEIHEGMVAEYELFRNELTSFAQDLAKLVVHDGEGATKFVTVHVHGAPSYDVAKTVASSVANSNLVKTAMYGEDANWGRILCAVGYSSVPEGTIDPHKVSVSMIPAKDDPVQTPMVLLKDGEPDANLEANEDRATNLIQSENVTIDIDLGQGKGEAATYWTCDLSHDYVTINGDVSFVPPFADQKLTPQYRT
ncbi:arginine biosynthesis-related protein [Trichosporon asahii var. asahii CBS 8904]|uniref:Arginine biosynthesis bifunctional protein ArgJ, mitochondrial n=1 Tax=Trichosporon asahii var. asahii (strain CBS 8904) TaxID=1220162 RepID=K1W9R5_TRIAC|nr:arginine biosynthesis-related protein [Trichosporon asahii var. asahii CBS 8904]